MTEATDNGTTATASGVVVGADGADHGKVAIRWAAGAASAYGLPLTVLFARPDATAVPELISDPTGVLGDAVAEAQDGNPGLEVRALQMPESPVESLLVASETADFLVLGSRGIGGVPGAPGAAREPQLLPLIGRPRRGGSPGRVRGGSWSGPLFFFFFLPSFCFSRSLRLRVMSPP